MLRRRDIQYDVINTGFDAARKFKYLSQYINPRIENPITIQQISCKMMYEKHAVVFDSFVKLFKKHQLDMNGYLEYFVLTRFKHEKDLNSQLLDANIIRSFLEDKQIKLQKKHMMKSLKSSATNIARECVEHGYPRSIDFFKDLISAKRLAAYYVSGIISKHFFAAIPMFPKLVKKLDSISRDEFGPLCSKFEKHSIDIQEAMAQENFKYSSVFDYVDSLIQELKPQHKQV